MKPAQPNRSLMNGLACLQAVAAAGHPVGSRETSRAIGLEHTRVNRLLGTLASIGLIEQNTERKYQPGAGIHILAAQSLQGSGLLAAALPHLTALRREGLMVALGVLWKRHICYIFSARPGESMERAIGRHELFPAEKSSIGLAIMAKDGETRVREFIREAVGSGEPFEKSEFLKDISDAKKRGYAVFNRGQGQTSIGVAIGEPPIAGIALAGKANKKSIGRLAGALKKAAENIACSIRNNGGRK